MSEQYCTEMVVGKRRGPTALVLGFKDEKVLAALRLSFPVLWIADSLPPNLDYDDVDYVIADGYLEPLSFIDNSLNNYLRRCRLIMLYGAPHPSQLIGFHGEMRPGSLDAQPPTLHPLLNATIKAEIAGIDDFSQWTTLHLQPPTKVSASNSSPPNFSELRPHAILISRNQSILGFVTNPKSSPFKHQKYRACLPWQVINPIDCINAIIGYWAHIAPEDHPFHSPWSAQRDWMTPEEREAFDEIERLNKEEDAVLSRINIERDRARQQLQKQRSAAEQGLRKLLTTQGDELVDITFVVLKHLGFSVQNMDEIVPAGQRKEDLGISHPDFDGETILCEVKGFSRSGGKGSDLGKLRKHIKRYYGDNGKKDPYRSWFIINGQFDLPPGQRQTPFQSDKETVISLEDDEKILVIGTCDLYRLLIDDTLTPGKRRQHLLAKEGGVFRWPPPK